MRCWHKEGRKPRVRTEEDCGNVVTWDRWQRLGEF